MAQVNFQVISKPFVAQKTLDAIKVALEKDGGSRYRKHLKDLIVQMDDAYREDNDEFRTHLGCSQIGADCLRELWYTFRWALPNRPHARFIRLLNRGHLEEARFISLLLMIDCEVWRVDNNGKQFRVSHLGGHYGGSCDLVVRGIPDWPEVPLLGECKTHKDDSFRPVTQNGVRVAKFKHYAQMQAYMIGFGLPGAIYLAVNKDDDDLYAELVPPDPELDKRQIDKARVIVYANQAPARINNSPGWWMCKMCKYRSICHKVPNSDTKVVDTIARNCRTCIYSKPVEGGWVCEFKHQSLSKEEQLKGCDQYTAKDM